MTTEPPRIYQPDEQIPGIAFKPFIKPGCHVCGSSGVKTTILVGPEGPIESTQICPCADRRFWKNQAKLRRKMAADLNAQTARLKAEAAKAAPEPPPDLDHYAKLLDSPPQD